MARNETITRGNKSTFTPQRTTCSNCNGALEPVGNRLFLMYKRARLPQPRTDAKICTHCGWVEGDPAFQALLEERINHR